MPLQVFSGSDDIIKNTLKSNI